jgi:hypothetical protein
MKSWTYTGKQKREREGERGVLMEQLPVENLISSSKYN